MTPTPDAPVTFAVDVEFPQGLFGFPECRQFALITAPRPGFYWLQSREYPTLAFLLADPFLYFEDYAVDLGAGDSAALCAADAGDLAVLVTVTLPAELGAPRTANLQGPLVINMERGLGRQIVINHPAFSVRQPLPERAAAAAA